MIPMHLLEIIFIGGAAYGAIRADIKNIHAGIAAAQKTADKANDRIDRMLGKPL